MTHAAILMTTVDSDEAAVAIAEAAMESGLAACVQEVPIRSTYRWKGEVERTQETLLLLKTTASAGERLRALVEDRHPYEVPETILVAADAAGPYGAWLAGHVDGA